MNSMSCWDYKYAQMNRLGVRVQAIRNLDPKGARVMTGEIGIVSELINEHGDGTGFLVKWAHGGICNVYPGDVKPATEVY